jgi:hypothetical protein
MVGAASRWVVEVRVETKAGLLEGANPETVATRRRRRVDVKVNFMLKSQCNEKSTSSEDDQQQLTDQRNREDGTVRGTVRGVRRKVRRLTLV